MNQSCEKSEEKPVANSIPRKKPNHSKGPDRRRVHRAHLPPGKHRPQLYYKWSKPFLEGAKQRLKSKKNNTMREAYSEEVSELCKENTQFKQSVVKLSLKNQALEKV